MDIKLLNQVEKESIGERQPLPEPYLRLSDDEMDARIAEAKRTLGERVVILGHHYQRDEVIKFADYTGDSLKLSRAAAAGEGEFIVFCGVHFMAECRHPPSAAPKVVCPISRPDVDGDMARRISSRSLAQLNEMGVDTEGTSMRRRDSGHHITLAAIKAFVGAHGGIVCTSVTPRR
jgi:quinolinate synthase